MMKSELNIFHIQIQWLNEEFMKRNTFSLKDVFWATQINPIRQKRIIYFYVVIKAEKMTKNFCAQRLKKIFQQNWLKNFSIFGSD